MSSSRIRRKKPRATIDFETRSAADIRNGPWIYARHPTTRVLVLCFLLPGQDPKHPSRWVPGLPDSEQQYGPNNEYTLERLFEHIREGGLVEAHNVMFERCIWHHVFSKAPSVIDGDPEWVTAGVGAPEVKDTQWRCSAAKCAAYALPRGLGDAGAALRLTEVKDDEGSRLMKLISKPRKALKKEPKVDETGVPIIYWRRYEPEEMEALYAYCEQDVTAEHYISEAVPDLSEQEYQVWLADFRANWRGVTVDIELVDAAIEMDRVVKTEMNEELTRITGIGKGTERAALMAWLESQGLTLNDSTAATLDWVMEQDMNTLLKDADGKPAEFPKEHVDRVHRVVEIARNINRTSITKYVRVKACMDPDDHKVRDLVMYHGAATGRWSGKGIQVQNFPRGIIGDITGLKPFDKDKCPNGWTMDMIVKDIKSGDVEWCRYVYGDILALLSSALRGVLIPAPGMQFYVADYSAIEARVVLWLADAEVALGVFYRGDDIYCDMASSIYGRPITKKDKDERQFGKVTILGLGYGMGFLTFLLTLRSYSLKFSEAKADEIMGAKTGAYVEWVTEYLWPSEPVRKPDESDKEFLKRVKGWKDKKRQANLSLRRLRDKREVPETMIHEMALCKFVVDAYRARYPEVVQLWRDQEDAACKAVELRDAEVTRIASSDDPLADPVVQYVECGKVTWFVEDDKLFCQLPSGRCLVYNNPFIVQKPTPWGKSRPELRFMGVHKKIKKWTEMGTYGGSIVENIDQATSRDMMAVSLAKVSEMHYDGDAPYIPVTSIHDELLSEAPIGEGDYKEYEGLLTQLPYWADGCPVAAEGDVLMRYQK